MLFLLPVALLLAGAGLADGGYELSWFTVNGGGGTSTGGGYSLSGTAGQPDAGFLTGGPYSLGGGFWGGGALVVQANGTYLPLVLRNGP
jgi:hypothetical protein